MEDLKIALVQTSLVWENHSANLDLMDKHLAKINDADIIVLPEMFTTGFSMEPSRLAEKIDGKTMQWLTQKAKEKNAVITGSFIVEENGQYFNRLVWMKANGSFESYDKRHLFSMAGENIQYTEGNKKLITTIKGWRICPLICYDLRFPVWSRNIQNEYDVLLYTANWPEARSHAWKSLLPARAIENQCYVAAANRIGMDGKALHYSGDSVVLDFLGKPLATGDVGKEEIVEAVLKYEELEKFRKAFPASLDQDKFEIS
jgi:omega-amidase